MRKGAGFAFTTTQIAELATKIYGEPITLFQWLAGKSIITNSFKEHDIGSFHYVHLPDGLDEDKDPENQRHWMIVIVAKELGQDETPAEYSHIPFDPFDPFDPAVDKALKWFMTFGHSQEEIEKRWMTLPETRIDKSIYEEPGLIGTVTM